MSTPTKIDLFKRLASSATACLVLLVILGLALIALTPATILDAADGVEGKYKRLVSKLDEFIRSEKQADIIVLGSSLVLMPATRCDDYLDGKPVCYDDWYYHKHVVEYPQSRYFEKLLANCFRIPISVANMGVASSIMSDHCDLFAMLLEKGKKPRLLIVGVAPRDFLDNTQKDYKHTPSQQYLREINSSGLKWPKALSQADLAEFYTSAERHTKKLLALIKSRCSEQTAKISRRKQLVVATDTAPYMQERPNRLRDLESYKKLYNPPNFQMLEIEKAHLEKMLKLAKSNFVPVLIINMPLTTANTDALDRAALAEYEQSLRKVCKENQATLLDIGSATSRYNMNDFEDCCHLNTAGGLKLYSEIIATISKDHKIAQALGSANTALAARSGQSIK